MRKRKTYRRDSDRRTEAPKQEGNAHSLDPTKARERTLQRAVKLLAAKPRSEAELRERLLEKEWTNEEAVEAALARLREYGYLDDQRFAFGFASYRVRQKPIGRQRLARDLQLKKVSRETADEALDLVFTETSEEQLIDRAIEKRFRLRGRPASRAETKSLFDHLLRLGFPYDLVINRVRAAVASANFDTDETGGPDED